MTTQMSSAVSATFSWISRATLTVRRAVTAIWPAWPIWILTPLMAAILLNTQQGRQGLIAVLTQQAPAFWATYLVLTAHSLLTFGEFLRATRRRMELFGRAIRYQRFNRWAAMGVSLLMPALVTAFIFHIRGGESPIDPRAAWISLGVLLFSFGANYWLGRQFYRLHETAYNQVAVVSFRYFVFLRFLLITIGSLGVASTFLSVVRDALGPVAILIIAMTLIGVILAYFVGLIHDHHWLPVPVCLFLLAIACALISFVFGSSYHDVRLIPKAGLRDLTLSSDHTRDWLKYRLKESGGLEDAPPIPAIFVISEGGGIYAARNSAGLLSDLDRMSDGAIYDSIFMMSGVSGGSVGIAAYLSARADGALKISTDGAQGDPIHELLGGDYISPLAAGLFFRDLPARFFPLTDILGFRDLDRATVFEAEYARRWLKACANAGFTRCSDRFNQAFVNVVDEARLAEPLTIGGDDGADTTPADPGPIVAFSTVKIESGRNEVVSNVRFDATEDNESPARLYNVLDRTTEDKTLSLATAAHMSARFPMISPTAMISERKNVSLQMWLRALVRLKDGDSGLRRLRYVDGGYADNSGAQTALRSLDELYSAARELDQNYCAKDENCVSTRIRPIVLHIYARRKANPRKSPAQQAGTNWFEELVNPLVALYEARAARGGAALENFCRSLALSNSGDSSTCRMVEINEQPIAKIGGAVKSPGLGDALWIDAPVDISADIKEKSFVPLGWSLGGGNDHIKERHAETNPKVCAAFRKQAPQAKTWQCSR